MFLIHQQTSMPQSFQNQPLSFTDDPNGFDWQSIATVAVIDKFTIRLVGTCCLRVAPNAYLLFFHLHLSILAGLGL